MLVGDPDSGSVRAYRRGEHRFEWVGDSRLRDQTGSFWTVGETALRASTEGTTPAALDRLPGHVALWFGWYGFYPQTEVWRP